MPPRNKRCLGPTPFQMLLDGHVTKLVELIGGAAFAPGDAIEVREEAGRERNEYLTGRECVLRVTHVDRLTKALPVGVVVLTVELTQRTP